MQAHITAHSLISPQETFFPERFLQPVQETDELFLTCRDPEFKEYIPSVQLRRMSLLLKRSLTAGGLCIREATQRPDAIVIGTGRACVNDLNSFLHSVAQPEQEGLSPITFVNSSHNTVAAQLALKTGNTGYNATYCHRGLSFESALIDALMLLGEQKAERILVGGLDEYSSASFRWDGALKYWKTEKHNTTQLIHSGTPGTISGEGTSFFMLEGTPSSRTKATLKGVCTRFGSNYAEMQAAMMQELTAQTGEDLQKADVVLLGNNGDSRLEEIYTHFTQHHIPASASVAAYKHLCGEYMTASGFALWLGCYLLEKQEIPEVCLTRKGTHRSLENILLYNSYGSEEHSLMLLSLPQPVSINDTNS